MVPATFSAPIENPLPRKSRQCDSKMRSISEQSFRWSGALALSRAKMIEEGCVMRKCTHFRNQFAKINVMIVGFEDKKVRDFTVIV